MFILIKIITYHFITVFLLFWNSIKDSSRIGCNSPRERTNFFNCHYSPIVYGCAWEVQLHVHSAKYVSYNLIFILNHIFKIWQTLHSYRHKYYTFIMSFQKKTYNCCKMHRYSSYVLCIVFYCLCLCSVYEFSIT